MLSNTKKKSENENRYDKRMAFIYTYKGIERFTAVDLTYSNMLTTQLGKICPEKQMRTSGVRVIERDIGIEKEENHLKCFRLDIANVSLQHRRRLGK